MDARGHLALVRGDAVWHLGGVATRLLDALVYSSLWLAFAAGALVAAACRAMAVPVDPVAAGLAACGTLVVYNVDRLRDVARDRRTAPERTRFVERHRWALVALTAVGALAAGGLALGCGLPVVGLLAPVLAAGLLHRRLKHLAFAKPVYLVAAWLAVVVGLPWLRAGQPRGTGWALACLGLAILANAIASNVRDAEAGAARIGPDRALAVARASALLAVAIAALAPAPRALLPVAGATLLVLVPFRPTERYGLCAVDGALLVGALAALLVS